MREKILLYNGLGTSQTSVLGLLNAFNDLHLDECYEIIVVDHETLSTSNWQKNTKLLAFPGGRDLPYQEKLQGAPNYFIREFVLNGGTYLGICAGAYYGCSYVEFESGGPLEVIGKRELQFFPFTAKGPIYGRGVFLYDKASGERLAVLKSAENNRSFLSYYKGGCGFSDAEKAPNTEVLMRYADLKDRPAAIIRCRFGKGKAILSGVHPEIPVSHYAKAGNLANIAQIERSRKELLLQLLSSCDLCG